MGEDASGGTFPIVNATAPALAAAGGNVRQKAPADADGIAKTFSNSVGQGKEDDKRQEGQICISQKTFIGKKRKMQGLTRA